MRNTSLRFDEQFAVIYPDLAALYHEVESKKVELAQANSQNKKLELEIEALQYELEQRLAILENWQKAARTAPKKTGKHSPTRH